MRSFLDKGTTHEFSFVTALPSNVLHDLCESARASVNDPARADASARVDTSTGTVNFGKTCRPLPPDDLLASSHGTL